MVSRASLWVGVTLGASGCIPNFDFTPCEETGTCSGFDAVEGGDVAAERGADGGDVDGAMDAPTELGGDVAKGVDVAGDVTKRADAGDATGDGGDGGDGDGGASMDATACAEGTADCDGVAGNGCEVDTRTSAAHCGACGVSCRAPVGGAARCAAGRCELTCDAGHVRTGDTCAPIVAPRLVAPLSPHTVTSQTPRLRWALGAGTDGVRVELCRERSCATVAQRFEATGASATVPAALAPGAWFWRAVGTAGGAAGVASSATWEFFVGHRSAPVNTAWGQATDVNGDGYADLVFAAGESVYVYAGSARGLATTPTTLVPAPGRTVQGLSTRGGDVDGDGFGDVLVFAAPPGETLGVALLLRGGASGLGATPARTYDPAASGAALLGDVNGDGYGDFALSDAIVVGAPGGPADMRTTPPVNERVTYAAGDLNGDGFADGFRCTFVRLRATCTASLGSPAGLLDDFGATLDVTFWPRLLFDSDGDGRSDFAAILPSASMPGQWIGYGGASTPTLNFLDASSTFVGAGLGDLDRDGLSESVHVTFTATGELSSQHLVMGTRDRRLDVRRRLELRPGIPFATQTNTFAVGDTNGDGVDDFAAVDRAGRVVHLFGAGSATTGLPTGYVAFPSAATTVVYGE